MNDEKTARLRKYWHILRLSALGGPIAFSLRTGHFLSAITQRPMDRRGKPLPWYSYPAIRFLSQFDFSKADVLEFGGGQSTLWWAARARSVVCLDPHAPWVEHLRRVVPTNVEVHELAIAGAAHDILGDRKFDVIVVDAGSRDEPFNDRVENARIAFSKTREQGIVVVDNMTDSYNHPVAPLAVRNGWARIDFIGQSPGGINEYGTAVFFKEVPPYLHTDVPPVVRI